MNEAKTVATYKWEYVQKGSQVICMDNTFHGDGQVQAMCADAETAKVFVDILNESRKPENKL
jgi:hypothetical protein